MRAGWRAPGLITAVLDTVIKFIGSLGEANVEFHDSSELLDDKEVAETTGDAHFTDGTDALISHGALHGIN